VLHIPTDSRLDFCVCGVSWPCKAADTPLSVPDYIKYLEAVGLGEAILCPWCFDWEDIEDGNFTTDADGTLRFWCCWGCETIPGRNGQG